MIPSSAAVLRMARSSRYALAVVMALSPESSSFLRQRRTLASLISAIVRPSKCGAMCSRNR
jgi:hypothetical protein